MFRTFNMGIGLIVVVAGGDAAATIGRLHAGGETGATLIGSIVRGSTGVEYR